MGRRQSSKSRSSVIAGDEAVSQHANVSRGDQAAGSGIGARQINDTLSIQSYPQPALGPAEGVSSLDLAAGSLRGLFFAPARGTFR